MNDEYLWQKSGEDPETMELENALAVFRYREDDPPAVPIAEQQRPTRRWRFALAFAVPALAAVVVASVIWLQVGDPLDNSDLIFIYEPAPAVTEPPAPIPSPVDRPAEPSKQPIRRGEVQPTVASVRRKPNAKTRPHMTTAVALTKEERYAYQQLMLALSISGSKLKAVQDAVNGVEDTGSNTKQNNR